MIKLEKVFIEAVFLAPKVYGGRYIKKDIENEIVKVKGLKNPIPFNDLKSLTKKDSFIKINNPK
jgi:hypothetical protein